MMKDSLILNAFESGIIFYELRIRNNISKSQSMNVYLCMIDFCIHRSNYIKTDYGNYPANYCGHKTFSL